MKPLKLLICLLLAGAGFISPIRAQTSTAAPQFQPGKYCCEMPQVGKVCVVFKDDGSYTATGNLSGKEGTSRGTWKRAGTKIILTAKEETGNLVGYLTRFNIDDYHQGALTWLPKNQRDFAPSGGAAIYPRYIRAKKN